MALFSRKVLCGNGAAGWNFCLVTKTQLIAAAFLKACEDHMLAQQAGRVDQKHYLLAAMALETAYPDVVARVRQASVRHRKPS